MNEEFNKNIKSNLITSTFIDSMVIDTKDIVLDYTEIGIDSFSDNEIIKTIPIAKTVASIYKAYSNIREKNLQKNTAIFINELNSGRIDKKKLQKYQQMLKNNPDKAKEEIERVILLLDRTIDSKKALIYGKIYKEYINRIIDYDIFFELTEITDKLYISDLKILCLIHNGTISDTENRKDLYKIDRLNSLGLVGFSPKMLSFGDQDHAKQDSYIALTSIGHMLSKIIFSN